MAETVFQNLRVRGTLALVGLTTLVTAVITTLTVTTLTATTANLTTANVQTVSGATINAMQTNGIVNARTLSGNVLRVSGNAAVHGPLAVSGSIISDSSLSGATTLTISNAGDRKNQAACWGTGGALGWCLNIPSATGVCSCVVP